MEREPSAAHTRPPSAALPAPEKPALFWRGKAAAALSSVPCMEFHDGTFTGPAAAEPHRCRMTAGPCASTAFAAWRSIAVSALDTDREPWVVLAFPRVFIRGRPGATTFAAQRPPGASELLPNVHR